MSVLSDFEDRVANAVEGMFAGVFRAPVQPAELARRCGKEMDKHKKLGVGKVYAPTLYSVLLSPADGEQLGGFARTLAGELETYLTGYAREKGYELSTRPRVRFLIDDALKLGRFDVIGELMSEEEIIAELGDEDAYFNPDHAEEPVVGMTMVQPAVVAEPEFEPIPAPAPAPTFVRTAYLTFVGTGEKVELERSRVILGRLTTNDIRIEDKNASREHAAIERDDEGWALVDLGSTNGTFLNRERVQREQLRDGDELTIGVTELVFHESRRQA